MSFFSEFFNITESDHEQAVCCPFPHSTGGNMTYLETRPSAHVNTSKQVFHCKVCGKGYSESQFICRVLGCSAVDALRILKNFAHAENLFTWKQTRTLTDKGKEVAKQFKISDAVLEELHIATPSGRDESLMFPVFLHGQLMDIRTYTPNGSPKIKSRSGSMAGLIIPYDIWKDTDPARTTIICAGEKDMAVARSFGFNAITITGGEKMVPRTPAQFKDRVVAICYDNDGPGLEGAEIVANALYPYTKKIKVVTNFHTVCKEEGEDITDFFNKYGKTRSDLIDFLESTPWYVPSSKEAATKYPVCDLYTATNPDNIDKMLQSNIQIVAVTDTTFTIPTALVAEKFKSAGDKDTMQVGETRVWELTEPRLKDALHLMDNNFTEEAIKNNIKNLLKIPRTERFVKIKTLTKCTVFKAVVTDLFETNTDATAPMEFQVYSFDTRLESGQKYLVTYKLVPHPYKGQQLVMLVTDAVQANDSVTNFQLNDTHKRNLSVIRNMEGTVAERITTLTEKVKGLLGYNGNNTLIQAIDFAYHTVLQFNLGSFTNVRGYLDTLIVGESRTGKSSTADALRKEYNLGVFTSLAGNSATIPGLIGGSNKTSSGFQTRAGVIPQNHKGLIIFEEFGKCKQDIVCELTDIRSSNEVRIARVSGTMTLPALVRMIALTNVKTGTGAIKPIASYPDGISIVTELVGTAEDIARYDLIVILSDHGNSQINPFWKPEKALPTEVYQTRVRWVWSRTPEQVNISDEVGLYIMERSNELNKEFDSHIKIFGTEAWKKLTRLAIAIAGYLVSTDDTYEQLIVTKEHVDYAESYLRRIYDNDTFRLREFVEHERAYTTIDADGIAALQDIYTKYPALIQQLERSAICSKNMLSSAAGLGAEELNRALSRLTRGLFIQYQGYDILPTQRFRIGLSKINKNTIITRIGEE